MEELPGSYKELTAWMEGFGRWPAWLGALGCKCKKLSCASPSSFLIPPSLALPNLLLFSGSVWHLMGGLQLEWWEGGERSEEEEEFDISLRRRERASSVYFSLLFRPIGMLCSLGFCTNQDKMKQAQSCTYLEDGGLGRCLGRRINVETEVFLPAGAKVKSTFFTWKND